MKSINLKICLLTLTTASVFQSLNADKPLSESTAPPVVLDPSAPSATHAQSVAAKYNLLPPPPVLNAPELPPMSAKKEGSKNAAQPDLSNTESHVSPVTNTKLEGEGLFGPWRPNIPDTKELFLEKPFCEQVVTIYKLLIEVYEQFGSLSRGKNRWTASPCQKAVQRVSDSLRGLESHYRIFSQSSERKIHGTLYAEHMNLTKDCENKCSSQSAKKDKKDKYSTYERFCAIQEIFLNEHHKK